MIEQLAESAQKNAGTYISIAGQIFGAIQGAKARKKQQKLLDQQQQENKSFYDNNANKDFLQTNVAKDVVTKSKEALVDDRKNVAGRAAITGASDEAIAAGNAKVSKNYTDQLGRLAGMGTQYQNEQQRMYRGIKSNLDQNQSNIYSQEAESAANLGANAGDLMNTQTFNMSDPKAKKKTGGSDLDMLDGR